MTATKTLTANGSASDAFGFSVMDVTGTHAAEVSDVQRSAPAAAVARAVASKLDLPENIPWALRDDRTGTYLDDKLPIGDQIQEGAQVVVTPRTHLG